MYSINKNEKILLKLIFYLILSMIGLLSFNYLNLKIPDNVFIVLQFSIIFIFLIIFVAFLCFIIYVYFKKLKIGIHNITECDDELFNQIDMFKITHMYNDLYYIRQIKVINNIYRPDGPVDKLVQNNEIKKLLARNDFLERQLDFDDNYYVIISSIIVSIIAAFICNFFNEIGKMKIVTFFFMIIGVIGILSLFFMKYSKKGKLEEYQYKIIEYEKELLYEKIKQLEGKSIISDDDMEILKTQQIVLRKLKNIYSKEKDNDKRQIIKQYIKDVDNIKVYSYKDMKRKYIVIDGKSCCILDINIRKRNKDNNLDCLILNEVIDKYDMMD